MVIVNRETRYMGYGGSLSPRKKYKETMTPTRMSPRGKTPTRKNNLIHPDHDLKIKGNSRVRLKLGHLRLFQIGATFLLTFALMMMMKREQVFPPAVSELSQFFSRNKKHETCVITISALNNFGFVWTLYDSVMQNNPGINCFIWFVGDFENPRDKENTNGWQNVRDKVKELEHFTLVTMGELAHALDDFYPLKFGFMFDLVEFQTVVKPFAFEYTFQEHSAASAIYLDNDIWVTDSLEEIQHQLRSRSVVLTPHEINPTPEDGKNQKDINLLQAGVFNFGFVAFANSDTASKFLTFWGERLALYGFVDVARGMHFDQNWGMFIPAFFDHEDYIVLRDLRYNIAYWNLHDTGPGLHMKDGIPHLTNSHTGESERAGFVHFSGISYLEAYNMEGISIHQNRFGLKDFPKIKDVFIGYRQLLTDHNAMDYRKLPYGFQKFSDGSTITKWMREVYTEAVYPHEDESPYGTDSMSSSVRYDFRKHVYPNPFCFKALDCLDSALNGDNNDSTYRYTFIDWLLNISPSSSVDLSGAFYFSMPEQRIWDLRPDLQKAFPDPHGADYAEYKSWFNDSPVKEDYMNQAIHDKWREIWTDNDEHQSQYHKTVNKTNTIGVNILGWHTGSFSIGILGFKLIGTAKATNIPVSPILATPFPDMKQISPDELDIDFTRSASEAVTLAIMNADCTLFFEKEIPEYIRAIKYNIGYWSWELEVFPEKWMEYLKAYDEVWCPSSFVKHSIENSPGYDGTTPVKVLPIPLEPVFESTDDEKKSSQNGYSIRATAADTNDNALPNFLEHYLYGNDQTRQSLSSPKPFVFLVVFDFKSLVQRKNPEAAIRAFQEAFPKSSDKSMKYQLIVKSHSGTVEDVSRLRDVAGNDERIVFINENLSPSDLQALKSYQDCYLSLHRSEGYGMNILEAMASGIPVIATNYSGNVNFFNAVPGLRHICHFPVPYKLIRLEDTFGPYEQGNMWADPDHDYAVSAMREVVKTNCKKSSTRGISMARQINDSFGPENVGLKLKKLLSEARLRIIAKQSIFGYGFVVD